MTGLFWNAGSARADYVADLLARDPVGYWRLNETSGANADNIGSLSAAADGTYTGAVDKNDPGPPVDLGPGNTGIAVGPADGSVQTASSLLSNLSEFTLLAFIKPGVRSFSRIGIMGQNDAIEFGFISPNTLQVFTQAGGVSNNLDVPYPFPDGEWHHVAAVGTGEEVHICLDGQLAGTRAYVTGNYGSSGDDFNIGGGGVFDPSGNQFTGSIDEPAVLDKALSCEQIAALLGPGELQAPTFGKIALLLILLSLVAVGVMMPRRQ
jgi:hypothetical protein